MEIIDLNTWPRKEHFAFFRRMEYPQFNICVKLDVTHFLQFVKENGLSFYFTMGYASAAAANEIENFRYRIRGEQVVLHEKVHPSFTILPKGKELYKMVAADMTDDIHSYTRTVQEKERRQPVFMDPEEEGRDDQLYCTCTPWFSFTQVTHPIMLGWQDSIPRLSWGKYQRENGKVLLPYSLQANHCLMDGYHAGKYLERLQEYIDAL
ncbi:chloramphenicol acetyltransferase [Caproiciproducens galactitolivorans]|uniref:Chloramphenicol acetyltransferase 2 n=1 Tax=Caproiciproducens galactitolivorans TaxID=642589 RepID=A0A4Z0YDX3_9FIRM|nr:chloramphenicol acetyltransferase [Caproiciproducens galactitolivorans]QEY35323.1 chloramphenicol acetyltransferase [Caproiciproducens galactitolivorans]TGJ77023.1 chloramphenicol acetyltransferase 2 [Caproiciproducens galactitolivorans]